MGVEVKTIGELIDGLITTSNKIYHLIDRAVVENDGDACLQVQALNIRRNEFIRAINDVIGKGNIDPKVFNN